MTKAETGHMPNIHGKNQTSPHGYIIMPKPKDDRWPKKKKESPKEQWNSQKGRPKSCKSLVSVKNNNPARTNGAKENSRKDEHKLYLRRRRTMLP